MGTCKMQPFNLPRIHGDPVPRVEKSLAVTPLINVRPGRIKKGGPTLKIFWEDWYAREISRFVCNKVRLFQVG